MDLQSIVQLKEKELRQLRSEVGIAFDAAGHIILERIARPGAEYEIEFTDEEIETLRAIGNVTFTHNHPRGWEYPPGHSLHAGSSFSPEDILLACRAELAEIRAVTPVYTFSMMPSPESRWTETTWNTDISPLYETVYTETKSRLFAAVLHGALHPAEASARLHHEIWTEVAHFLGLRYNRSEE